MVWYSEWQMGCCGEPFSVGDSVEWNLSSEPDTDWLVAAIGRDLAARITYAEDHHDMEQVAVAHRGKVVSIRCAYCMYAPVPGSDSRGLYPVAGTTEVRSVNRADGTEGRASELMFIGYVVDLRLDPTVEIAPAEST